MATKKKSGNPKKPTLTTLQKRFVEEYLVDFNGTQAAIRAGYSPETARQIGYENLTKPYILDAIKKRLDALTLTAEGAAKVISDIATSKLNDYMVVKKVLHTPKVRKPLLQLIEELNNLIAFEDEVAETIGYEEEEFDAHEAAQDKRRKEIIRYEIELKHNPEAYRDVYGEAVWVEQVEVDLVALARDKEKGRIKKLKWGEFGPEVELYAADSNAAKLLEYHGKIDAKQNLNVQVGIVWKEEKTYETQPKTD